jgi:hypothetical protein
MDGTSASATTNTGGMGAGRVFLSDVRLAAGVLNYGRHIVLRRYFGVSREQANVLSFILALGAAQGALRTTRRMVSAPFRVSRGDALIGGYLVREGGLGIAGPGAREVPLFGTLLAFGMLGGLAVPEVRRALRGLRTAERRVREQRMRIYGVGQRAASQGREAVAPSEAGGA